jgi:hypothetical protein
VTRATALRRPYVLPLNEYLRFLFTNQLIELVGPEQVKVTDNGAGFCDYLAANNLSVAHPL